MTKIEMINMAIDLAYIQGRIHSESTKDCDELLTNTIDTLVENAFPELAEDCFGVRDGCEDCVYIEKLVNEYPCNKCVRNKTYKDKWLDDEDKIEPMMEA